MPVATVLYEDKMQVGSNGAFPPHDFVLSMISGLIGKTIWELRTIVEKNPRNGVNKLIADLGRADLLAGAGYLCVLVDFDRIAEQLGLNGGASEAEVIQALRDCVKARQPGLDELVSRLAELCERAVA